jgi:hypothetical protein
MAPQTGLAPAGSSTYSSNTLTVGDGTWDSSRNDFLLPNLVGLNFDTMRYNGMCLSFYPLIYGLTRRQAVTKRERILTRENRNGQPLCWYS